MASSHEPFKREKYFFSARHRRGSQEIQRMKTILCAVAGLKMEDIFSQGIRVLLLPRRWNQPLTESQQGDKNPSPTTARNCIVLTIKKSWKLVFKYEIMSFVSRQFYFFFLSTLSAFFFFYVIFITRTSSTMSRSGKSGIFSWFWT